MLRNIARNHAILTLLFIFNSIISKLRKVMGILCEKHTAVVKKRTHGSNAVILCALLMCVEMTTCMEIVYIQTISNNVR